MELTVYDREMLEGAKGKAARKSMEILVALGEIYGAERLIDVASVQIAGVSYDNLGDAGLEFLQEMAGDGRVHVLSTLNPAGMDVENWRALGISEEFAFKQKEVIAAFAAMGVTTTCTCTPYYMVNIPKFGQHIAWAESSAICYANSVIGARTNREGGPSALAAALTGRTPEYGLHLDENRMAEVTVEVKTKMADETDFGALGRVIGAKADNRIPFIKGIRDPALDLLKNFSASLATYGGTAMFHLEGITPDCTEVPWESIEVTGQDIDSAKEEMNDDTDVDFVSLGCPHLSLDELSRIASLLEGKQVKRETWVHVARPVKKMADKMGYTRVIEEGGAKFACDTCMVVAPLKGRFQGLATNSAKAVFYGRAKNDFKVVFKPLEQCLQLALT